MTYETYRIKLQRITRDRALGGCPQCGAGGKGPVQFVIGTDPERPEPLVPCSLCGETPQHFTFTFDRAYDPEVDDLDVA